MPVFLKEVNPACPVSSDMRMSISYLNGNEMGEAAKVSERVQLADVRKIYLIKNDNAVALPRYIWDDGYSYQVCFPIKPEEANNAFLIVNSLADKHTFVRPHRLRYYNDYVWAMGYLGAAFNADTTVKP